MGGGLKSTPLAFFSIAAGGSEILAGVQPPKPPVKYSRGALHVFGWLSCVSAESAATRRVASDGSVCPQHSACVLNDVGLYVCRCSAGFVDIEGLCYRQYCICSAGWLLAEWLACWTQAQKGPGSNRHRDAVG